MNLISTLFYYSNLFQSSKVPIYKRSIYHKINFSHKLIGLKGAKGVGKTTLLHQYLNSLEFDVSEKLYISMDNPLIGATRLLSIAEEFQKRLYNYINALERGKLIHLLYYNKKGNALFQKPDKILLDNPNLFKVLCFSSNIGAIRESFFVSMLHNYSIRYSKSGDYFIDNKYTFEIGGKNKDFKQIKNLKNSYLVIDNIETGDLNKVPIWLFGFLY
jgi:predicted AAA+ superfamily ATPase